jgi:ADP-L-glycero-D-manno-heptose 6-epimerase
MKCLVTGGAGFIGSNLAIFLEKDGHEVVVADNFSSGHSDNISDFKGKVIDLDLSKDFGLDEDFDVIFHQAAITDPRYPHDNETIRQNVDGFYRILQFALKSGAKLIYASTASLYGNGAAPQKEDRPKELLSAYAKSKLIMDEMACHHFDDMHIIGLRYFNVFGPREEKKGRPASMVYHLAKQMMAGNRPKIFKMGEQKRDHIYVKDCVLANIKALDAKSGIYNVGTGVATSFNELVKVLNDVLDTNLEPEYIDMPYDKNSYQSNTQADTSRAKNLLGFSAEYDLKRGVKEYLDDFNKKRIVVIGDLMLDKYIFGKVERISPEAPVQIVTVEREKYVPGGAANAASNVSSLSGEVYLVGIVGNDIAKDQQLLRIDYENNDYIDNGMNEKIIDRINQLEGISAIIVSDYAKGTVTKELMIGLRGLANEKKIQLIVDPKPRHKLFYRDVNLITPNKKEAEEMSGIVIDSNDALEKAGKKIMDDLGCNVIITTGEKGMSIFEAGRGPVHIPTVAKEVYDVSGAGDTVIATLGLALSCGASLKDSALIANHAAGIKVGKLGTATVSKEELAVALNQDE